MLLAAPTTAQPAPTLPTPPHPQLSVDRLIGTSPFVGSSVRTFDNEGSAYVPVDDSLWMADDQADALFEVDRTTGALRRRLGQSVFINAPRFSNGQPAGQLRNEDLEALAYDAAADVLYAFSGATPSSAGPSSPTVYRLSRNSSGRLEVDSWRALPMESPGAGWRAADGLLDVGNRSSIRTYDYATNTFGQPFSIPGLTRILGLDFDDASGDLLAVNNRERLYRASMTTHTLLDGWDGIDLVGLGFLDSRAVEVIGDQLFVTDGADRRPTGSPLLHAVFVLDVTTDTTGPNISITRPAADAVYPRNQAVLAAYACVDNPGGTGIATCVGPVPAGQPIDTAGTGTKSFTVTGTDEAGNVTEVTRSYRTANARPDGRIRRGGGRTVGNNVYNTTAVGQRRLGVARRGRSVTYVITAQNDAPFTDRLRVRGQGSTARFRVRYRNPANVDVTNRVVAGTYRTPMLAPGERHAVRAIVTVKQNAPRRATKPRTVTIASDTHPAIKDVVRFVTRRS